jgi:hypothetical protein
MTFCAVRAAVFLIYRHLTMWTGVIAAIATGALSGVTSGSPRRDKPIYFKVDFAGEVVEYFV